MKRLLSFLLISFLLGFSPAANAATFSLSPPAGEFGVGCEVSINILLNTEGAETSAADMFLYYNANEVELIDQDKEAPGVQILPGDLFDSYTSSRIDAGLGKIQSTAFNTVGTYNSGSASEVYATIVFKPKQGARATSFTFDYVAESTVDSNVVDVSRNDALTGVQNATYVFSDIDCGDVQAPQVTQRQPASGSADVSLGSNVALHITDDRSGVDINTVRIRVADTLYIASSAGLTYSGDPLNYSFVINPVKNFPSATPIMVIVDSSDFEGNAMATMVYGFNYPFVLPPQPKCGNGIVEEGEQCEPAGTLVCNEECQMDLTAVLKGAAGNRSSIALVASVFFLLLVLCIFFMPGNPHMQKKRRK